MVKGCKSIAEYAFRRWMEEHMFVQDCFILEVEGTLGIIHDSNGDTLTLAYDGKDKSVRVAE